MKSYDAIVVGGGHNGLVAAAYLARAGLKVFIQFGTDAGFLLLTTALFASLAGCNNAAQSSGIGLVDVQRISQNWPKFQNYANQLQASFAAIEASKSTNSEKQQQLAQLQTDPAHTLMVGDHASADTGGVALGIRTLVLPMRLVFSSNSLSRVIAISLSKSLSCEWTKNAISFVTWKSYPEGGEPGCVSSS